MQKNNSAPPRHMLFGNLLSFRKDPLGFLTHCARNYGEVVPLSALGQSAFLLLLPADIERVLVTDRRGFIKPPWLRFPAVLRLLGDGLVTSDGSAWRQQRQACQPAFHLGLMAHYGECITSLAGRMLQGWEPGQTRDVQRDMTRLTLEVIAGTLLDVHINGWTDEASAAMDTLMTQFASGRSLFGLLPLPPAWEERRAVRQLDAVVDFLIRSHQTSERDKSSDLISLLQRPAPDGTPSLSPRELREQIKTFLAAGHESSALALSWAGILLAQHPEVDARLAEELDTVLRGRAPMPADLPRLVYTDAVIKEVLRLYPPLWLTGRRAAQKGEIGGLTVPAGAIVLTSPWAVQRDPRHFTRPDEFRPERWLNGETETLPRFAYFPFGGGPRVCIGQSFAMMEMSLILAAIAQRFRLELTPMEEVKPWATMTLRPPAGIRLHLHARGYTGENHSYRKEKKEHGL